MIVEYFGIPGSGKTFQANIYRLSLDKQRTPYLDISRHKGMALWLKGLYKLADAATYIIPKYRSLSRKLQNTCDTCLKAPKYLSLSMAYCVRDIVLSSLLHDVFDNWKRVIINDEGMLQRVATLAVLYNADVKGVLSVCWLGKKSIQNVMVDISVDEAFQNIRGRNRHACEMDELDDDMLYSYLKAFGKTCNDIKAYLIGFNDTKLYENSFL